jgi:ribosomal protein S18 acetylase RimI-like enzyme
MIQIIRVSSPIAFEETLKNIYLDSFPSDERREWDELIELTQKPYFTLYRISYRNETVGLITVWEWQELAFIEHFAINKSFQGQGIGSKVLNQLQKKLTSSVILETELPNNELAIRRINFYTRLGFHICEEEYLQPAYDKNKKTVKMSLMSYPDKINHPDFIAIRNKLYKEVYRRNITEFP